MQKKTNTIYRNTNLPTTLRSFLEIPKRRGKKETQQNTDCKDYQVKQNRKNGAVVNIKTSETQIIKKTKF